MSGQTIRDVVIKIRLEQQQAKLQAPDTRGVSDAVQRASKASTEAFSREEKEAVRAYSRIMKEREKAATAAEKLADRTARYADNIDPTGGKVLGNEAAYQERQRENSHRAEQAIHAASMASTRQRIEAFTGVGESALRAARGVAFLTAANEEDLKIGLQRVAVAQGILDVYSGSFGAYSHLTKLTESQTAAQIALNVACSVTPAGWAAIGVAMAAAGAIYALTTEYTREQNAALEHQQGTLRGLGTDWELLARQAERGAESLASASRDFDSAMEALRTKGQKRGTTPDEMFRDLETETTIRKQALMNASDRGNLGVGVLGAAKRDAELARMDVELLQQQLAIRERQTTELEKQRAIAQEALEISKRTIEAEKDRLQSQTERIGRMSRGDQLKLAGISEKVQRGDSLTEFDARELDRLGVGREQSNAFFRQRGEAAGADQILSGLGETKALEQMKKNFDALDATHGEFVRESADAIRDSYAKQDQAWEKLVELIKARAGLVAKVDRLEKQLNALETQQINGSVGRTWSQFLNPFDGV